MTDAVRVARLSKSYLEGDTRHRVFSDLSMTLAAGEQVALLGPSGSGKSTLLNLLAGLDRPDEGSVEVLGQRVDTMDEAAVTRLRRRHIGFVFQFFNLIPTLTVRENLRLPLALNRLDEGDDARIAQTLAAVGLGDRGDSYPERLSGGEQQRIACLRALIHRPALLLADEPTGNLDVRTGETVLALLIDQAREAGSSVLTVTHSDEVASRMDRVLVLTDGRLAAA